VAVRVLICWQKLMPKIQIGQGDLKATVNSLGSSLISLAADNFCLIEPDTPSQLYPGSILAPWPNRIRDGRYQYNNLTYQLPLNEPQRANALHGLVAYEQWEVIYNSESEVQLQYLLDKPDIYPGKLSFNSFFKIKNNQLQVKISAKNIGVNNAPYGVSIHTYLLAGGIVRNNDLNLKIPADKYLAVDETRLLPIGLRDVVNTRYDFRNGKAISDLFIDHAFKYSKNQPRQVELLNSQGDGAVIEFDDQSNWIQVHTADRDGGENSRVTVAVEPMSCPADAFNSKVDLIELAPQSEHCFMVKIWRKERGLLRT
jgi:aldose 1-epimerase